MKKSYEKKDIDSFSLIEKHLERADWKLSDPYDVWNMKVGQNVKKIYYKHKILGLAPAAILTLFDFYINNEKRIGYSPREYPIVRAYHVLINLELYKQNPEERFICLARKSLDWLCNNYSTGYSGYCWGINMPWVSKIATYDINTPHVTHTPYVLEAFIDFQKVTNTYQYDHIIDSVLDFLDDDLNKIIDDKQRLALSYSPVEESRIVINANSYAMYCYALLFKKNPEKNAYLKDKIIRLYHFILINQENNGSWFYFADKDEGNFIDCFHSCFVLKNIYKTNKIIDLPHTNQVIRKGYQYVKNNFWDGSRGLFRRFSITDRLSLIKYDLYDNAEMLNMANLLGDKSLSDKLIHSINSSFVVGNNIYSNIIFPNKKINKNTLRWAVFPYLYALGKSLSSKKISKY